MLYLVYSPFGMLSVVCELEELTALFKELSLKLSQSQINDIVREVSHPHALRHSHILGRGGGGGGMVVCRLFSSSDQSEEIGYIFTGPTRGPAGRILVDFMVDF